MRSTSCGGSGGRRTDTLASLPCWGLLADKEQVLGMLHQKLREQGLLVYLHAYSAFYHSLSHQHLMSLFELPEAKVLLPSSHQLPCL